MYACLENVKVAIGYLLSLSLKAIILIIFSQ